MPSSRGLVTGAALAAALAWAPRAAADTPVEGFAVERLYQSAPGAGWVVMDALDMRGGLGGALALSTGYAHDPLRVRSSDGTRRFSVVSDEAFADFGLSVTYDRFRFYLNLDAPLVIDGFGGTVGSYAFTAPSVDLGSHPDTLSDARLGTDVRFYGGPSSPLRLGAGLQVFIPFGDRADYDTDHTLRAMGRLLLAGDAGRFTYAAQLGVHVRPLDDSPAPGSPQGSELLFGAAGGPKLLVRKGLAAILGPELFGATAFKSFFGSSGTALEGLLSGRLEGTADDGVQFRVKAGAGAGLYDHFGAPEWRLVFAVEVFDHDTDRDRDGVSDSQDACPDMPGVRTRIPSTNGCPLER